MINLEYLKKELNNLSFREKNEIIFELYERIINGNGSAPLLIPSSDEYLNEMNKKHKIMYVGKENYGWLNNVSNYSLNDAEEIYIKYLKGNAKTTLFWDFYKLISYDSKTENIIWTNTYLGGDKYENKRLANYYEIEYLSLYYLISIYERFNPDCIVFVCGPEEIYNRVFRAFSSYIKSNITYDKPRKNSPLIMDSDKKIYYTYHPQFLGTRVYDYNNVVDTLEYEIQKSKKKIIL